MSRNHNNPRVGVNVRGAARVRAGHPWVYRSDLRGTEGVPAASLVTVTDPRGKVLGTALYSNSSQIAVRMISAQEISRADWLQLVRRRVADAVAYRRRVVHDSDAFRVIFSEADLLPGIIVDRYGDYLSMQVLTQAMDSDDVRDAVVESLVEELGPTAIFERVEPRIRELEKLPARQDGLLWSPGGAEVFPQTEFTMNGLRFLFDASGGQKTGAFLDQRENYAAAERWARGRALDICTYHGGFALHLNRVCESVTAVDVSRPALEVADANWKRNEAVYGGREIEFIEANAFDLLRDFADAGEQYDTIVLDPPAFAKTRANLPTALRGYKEMNLRALKMLRPGGILVTCSCSFHVGPAEFMAMLGEAAADAKRNLRILETRAQSLDHPVLVNVPETHYLKCIIATVD